MTLTLDSLKKQGAFTGAPVKKEITWESGGEEHKANVYVRPLSYRAAVYDVQASQGLIDGYAGRIAACICDEKGKAVFTPEDITGEADPERGSMCSSLALALMGAIGEVNSLGKRRKNSATKTSSGTNSSSPASAATPSKTPSGD